MSKEHIEYLERHTVLESIDALWQQHLYAMDGLRSSMSLRVYAQKDPLVEYKNEAYNVFKEMMSKVYLAIVNDIFRVTISGLEEFESLIKLQQQQMREHKAEEASDLVNLLNNTAEARMQAEAEKEVEVVTYRRTESKVGRNDPCPCGSGQKYKKCCGK